MEGAYFQEVLSPDDFFESQAPGLAHVHLDDEGPWAFDVHLGQPFAHAAPNQAVGQDGPAFEGFAPPFMQPGLGNEDQPGLVDLEYEQADEVPHHLPVALDAVEEVITFLQANLPELALHPNGPGLVLALHAALGHYMLAHGMTVNALAMPLAPHEDLLPLDGFVEVAGQPGDDGEVFVQWPEVQDDGGAGVDDLFGADDVLAHLQDAHDHPDVEHAQNDAALNPEHVLEVLPDVGPALDDELELAMEPELVEEPVGVPPADGVVVNHENEDPGAANLVAPEGMPPPYEPAPEPEPAEEVNDESEPEPEVIANVHHQIEEVVPPIGSDMMVELDEDGRAALSLLCNRFAMADDLMNLNHVLAQAEEHIQHSQYLLRTRGLQQPLQPDAEAPAVTANLNQPKAPKRLSRIFKLRGVWKRTFSNLLSTNVSEKGRSLRSAVILTA